MSKELNDNGDNGYEAIILANEGAFEPHNFYFGGKKWRDKWHCEVDDLKPKDFQEIFEEQRKKEENFGCDII